MKNKILYIVDSYSIKSFHEVFNAGFLVVCGQAVDQIVYRADFSNQKRVLNLIRNKGYESILEKIEKKALYVINNDTTLGILFRTLFSVLQNIFHLLKGGKNPIIFMHNDAFSIYCLSIINLVIRRPIWIVCHGELELLLQSPQWYKPSFLYKYLYKFFFKFVPPSRYMHFIVLGESIQNNLGKVVSSRCMSRFVSINHPYFFDQEELPIKSSQDQLLIGTVGTMNVFKGLNRLFCLADLLEKSILDHLLTIRVIGKLENVDIIGNKLLQISKNPHEILPREEYVKLIKELDYVLFLYDVNSYKLTASGAIFDAISFGKPIIALKNDYFNIIFKQCGAIGYLCETIEELQSVILNLLKYPDKEGYKIFLANMKKVRYLYRPENIELKLY